MESGKFIKLPDGREIWLSPELMEVLRKALRKTAMRLARIAVETFCAGKAFQEFMKSMDLYRKAGYPYGKTRRGRKKYYKQTRRALKELGKKFSA